MVYMYIAVLIKVAQYFFKNNMGGRGGEGIKMSHNTVLKTTCHVATGEPVIRYSK